MLSAPTSWKENAHDHKQLRSRQPGDRQCEGYDPAKRQRIGSHVFNRHLYSDLLRELDKGRERQKVLLPQSDQDDYETVDLYLKVNNNLGVTLHRLAQQTGNSNMNAEAMVRLSDSIRAWDALTRNQQTMIRMEGSNLAAQNSKYITHPYPDFEPAIYTDIPRLLSGEKGLE